MNRTARIAASSMAALALAVVSGCAGGGGAAGKQSPVDGGTLAYGITTDPGNLDPQRSDQNDNQIVAHFAYDTPVTLSGSGALQPGIVTKWRETSTTSWQLTVRRGVTCSDGSAMDAKTVADNLDYVSDPKNSNPYAGVAVPAGSTATADTATSTVTVKVPSSTPFLMQNLAALPLVCEKGLSDRASLATASDGSGPYVIADVVPGDHIDYTLRKGYTWGPPGAAATSASGVPAKITVKIVSSATTTANLLLTGQLNAAGVTGTDQKRLTSGRLFSAAVDFPSDFVWFNHGKGLPGADPDVRKALVMGLDSKQLTPAETAGLGKPATGLQADPKVCPGNTVAGSLPGYDPAGAKALLTRDGWAVGAGGIRSKNGKQLKLTLAYASDVPGSTTAVQLVDTEWRKLGVNVVLAAKPKQQLVTGVLGSTLDWDTMLLTVGVNTPAQFSPFVSGPTAPKGQNFSSIDNARYNSLIATAAKQPGTKGCVDWNAAESALFADADLAPTGQQGYPVFGKNATFKLSGLGTVLPTTLRLLH